MKKIWVVEEGDYEQRYVMLVGSSPEAALSAIKNTYDENYIVEWSGLNEGTVGQYQVVGKFEWVPGKSTKHTAFYDLTEYDLH